MYKSRCLQCINACRVPGAFGDWKSGVIQTRHTLVPPGSAYTIGFSHTPVYNTHLTARRWNEGPANMQNRTMQTFSRCGTLPSYSAHQERRSRAGDPEQMQAQTQTRSRTADPEQTLTQTLTQTQTEVATSF